MPGTVKSALFRCCQTTNVMAVGGEENFFDIPLDKSHFITGGTIEEQINGAFDHMESRLRMVDLTLEDVIQMDCLFRDVWNIPVMEEIIRKRFNGK